MLFRKNRTTGNPDKPGFWQRLRNGLARTREGLFTDLSDLIGARLKLDAELLEAIETRLLMADVGLESTTSIISSLESAFKGKTINSSSEVMDVLREQMVQILKTVERPLIVPDHPAPCAILVVGVNGVGKTTSIGKLTYKFRQVGKHVILAGGDTFRAAAIEQLKDWGDRNSVTVVTHPHGSDSAAVIYDGLQVARNKKADILIADTAGRLHNKSNLMEELRKIRRTITKFDPDIPVEVLLVLDANNGQNALAQASQFHDAIGITGIILTKLDGSARGGIVFALARNIGVPLCFIGVGEAVDDLDTFNAAEFVNALLSGEP